MLRARAPHTRDRSRAACAGAQAQPGPDRRRGTAGASDRAARCVGTSWVVWCVRVCVLEGQVKGVVAAGCANRAGAERCAPPHMMAACAGDTYGAARREAAPMKGGEPSLHPERESVALVEGIEHHITTSQQGRALHALEQPAWRARISGPGFAPT